MRKLTRTLPAILCGLAFTTASQAGGMPEPSDLGIIGGLNMATLTGSDADPGTGVDKNRRMGITIGAYTVTDFNQFKLRTEIAYTQKGTVYDDGGTELAYKYSYIEAPILLQYDIDMSGTRISLFGGPYFALLLGAEGDFDVLTVDFKDSTKPMDLGLQLGANYQVNEQLSVGARYSMGLTEFDDTSPTAANWKHSGIGLTVGYSFKK